MHRGTILLVSLSTLVTWLAVSPAPDSPVHHAPAPIDPTGFAATDAGGVRSHAPAYGIRPSVVGVQKVVVLRVYFSDKPLESRFTKTAVENIFQSNPANIDKLWRQTSYGKISISSQVTELHKLPGNRSAYIDDLPPIPACVEDKQQQDGGGLSCGDKFMKVLDDAVAVANAAGAVSWVDVAGVLVLMAQKSGTEVHRGQGARCELAIGEGGVRRKVFCGVFSENPSKSELLEWGRWAHEMGHGFQQAKPPHPSLYNSQFELLDNNLPGQTGVFEKMANSAFPGWMPSFKYIGFSPALSVGGGVGLGGGTAALWAMEYDPAKQPNAQAIKAYITESHYFLVSVRRRVLGDELNSNYQWGAPGTNGIPDEGVLIEEVSEGASPWVTVHGVSDKRNDLWQPGDGTFSKDGVYISVVNRIDNDNYVVSVRYDNAVQPDAMMYSWRSPPGNTWETTDIWVDSPINGYGTYSYGSWSDLSGNSVPKGNGDDPTVGQVNRLYARVRNGGGATATDIVVNFELTDPPGKGIAGATGWKWLGKVDKATFPTLASLAPGAFTDVYLEWKPDFAIPESEVKEGRFGFHTCVRVRIDQVPGEKVFGNQDGDEEQENISYFNVPPASPKAALYSSLVRLHNDDAQNPQSFHLVLESDVPPDWTVDFNGGQRSVVLAPAEVRELPIDIRPGGSPVPVGSIFGVEVSAQTLHLLRDDLDPTDMHPEYKTVGGVRVEVRARTPVTITCQVNWQSPTQVLVEGRMSVGTDPDSRNPLRLGITGVDAEGRFIAPTLQVVNVRPDGTFAGYLVPAIEVQKATRVACLFAGTPDLAPAGSDFITLQPTVPTPPPAITPPTPRPSPSATPVPVGPKACFGLGVRAPAAVIAAALAKPERIAGWDKLQNPGAPESIFNPRRRWLTLESRSLPYHPLYNGLLFKAGCP